MRVERLVGDGLFDAIDHNDVHGPALRIELEPELFLQRREQIRCVGINRYWTAIDQRRGASAAAKRFGLTPRVALLASSTFGFPRSERSERSEFRDGP